MPTSMSMRRQTSILATREAGRPVRAVMDCVIAAVAIRTASVLVHADRDVNTLAAVARDLRAVRALP